MISTLTVKYNLVVSGHFEPMFHNEKIDMIHKDFLNYIKSSCTIFCPKMYIPKSYIAYNMNQ